MNKLWNELLTKDTITRGWHLARNDVKQDFAEDLYSTDVYALDLDLMVKETINRLMTNTYQPRPLFRIEVPKGPLTFRPGAVLPIQDRVVLSALVLLMAPVIDKKLPNSVFSWRLKDPLPQKGPIFKESDITDLPFLKKRTIRERVDPFEGWYRLWPVFDKKTRKVFREDGYRFLATSDIAAYFENIQIPILRDSLLKHFPQEASLVNLMCLFLESWCDRTGDGRAHHRGIPQGNFVSSFLGNIFLLPLDDAFSDLSEDLDIKYYRYMDDVRIFARHREDARKCILVIARTLKSLHLNVQTAKTRIYDESQGEVSQLLIDNRVDDLSQLINEVQSKWKGGPVAEASRKKYLGKLRDIAKRKSSGGQKILGSRTPLEGLSVRAFYRWMTAHSLLESDNYINRLLAEISKSADSRLTRKLLSAARRFPRKRMIESAVMRMIKGGQIIFPHQEAECLRAIRYLSNFSEKTINHCWNQVVSQSVDRYYRMESAYCLSRIELAKKRIDRLQELFDIEADPYVQAAMACLLVQRREKNQEIVQLLVLHPNEKVRDIGKLFRTVKNSPKFAKETLRHSFRKEAPWVLCDNMPFVHLMAASSRADVRQLLLDSIREPRLMHPIAGLRPLLKMIFTRTRESLASSV